MILKLILFFIVFAKKNELVVPCDDDYKSDLFKDELGFLQMFQMFFDSSGEILNLPDEAITSSDAHSPNHAPKYSRMGVPKVDGKSHGWCAKDIKSSHIMVDLTTSSMVTGVATQG